MRLVTKLAAGGGLAATAASYAVIASGVLVTSATVVAANPVTPAATADSLTEFDSCPELLDWYVDDGVREVGPWGWDGFGYAVRVLDAMPTAAAADLSATAEYAGTQKQARTGSARTDSATGTNTQEADVDEPDVAKTDGRIVVHLVNQRRVRIDDVSGATPRLLGSYRLPARMWGGELLLVGDHVLVTGSTGIVDDGLRDYVMPVMKAGGARILDLDISDPTTPRLVHDDTYSGRLVSLRQYGDTVRVVTAASPPELPWVTPDRGGPTRKEARQRNRDLVRETTIEDWLPTVRDNVDGRERPLLGCGDVYHPKEWSGLGTVAVTTYRVGEEKKSSTVGVAAPGDVVYSSADRLYVTSTRWLRAVGGPAVGRIAPDRSTTSTQVHAFALDATTTRYAGSGHVDGTVRDRWSLDEHDGRLRVAWTKDGAKTRNGVTVLAEKDGELVPVGSVGGLGIDEEIQSVRWFDDLAVLVTFRQMDPLYTVDLSDPEHPRALGALKIPGYSAYLHPIGDDRLLGLGIDATERGRWLGSQAAVFDIADLTAPRRVSGVSFGKTDLAATSDPRAFTWLPTGSTGITLVTDWRGRGHTKAVALDVAPDGTLRTRDLAADVPYAARALVLADGRVALAGGTPDVLLLPAPAEAR